LLVVIAIIALLVSILLPSLNRAKELAKTAICKSNVRNLGMGFATYTSEYDGRILVNYAGPDDSAHLKNIRWFDVLGSYIGADEFVGTTMRSRKSAPDPDAWRAFRNQAGLLACPSDPDAGGDVSQWNFRASTYGVPDRVAVVFGEILSVSVPHYQSDFDDHSFADAKRPADTVLLGEARAPENNAWYFAALREDTCSLSGSTFNHNGTMNFLFLDGHAGGGAEAPHDFRNVTNSEGQYDNGVVWGPIGRLTDFVNEFGGTVPE
jgi:prepilin-type processing-associated H-X9-DG protein